MLWVISNPCGQMWLVLNQPKGCFAESWTWHLKSKRTCSAPSGAQSSGLGMRTLPSVLSIMQQAEWKSAPVSHCHGSAAHVLLTIVKSSFLSVTIQLGSETSEESRAVNNKMHIAEPCCSTGWSSNWLLLCGGWGCILWVQCTTSAKALVKHSGVSDENVLCTLTLHEDREKPNRFRVDKGLEDKTTWSYEIPPGDFHPLTHHATSWSPWDDLLPFMGSEQESNDSACGWRRIFSPPT